MGEKRWWAIGAGEKRGEAWSLFESQNCIAHHGSFLDDLTTFGSREAIHAEIKRRFPEWGEPHSHSKGNWDFLEVMDIGDFVVAKVGIRRMLGVGIVTSDYRFVSGTPGQYNHQRSVTWLWTGDVTLQGTERFHQKTLTELRPQSSIISLAEQFIRLQGRLLPEEIQPGITYREGATEVITVNAYERNPAAREACIRHYGYQCVACGVLLADVYGPAAARVIHVHHRRSLAEIGEEYEVHPIDDLCTVCPNCHAVIHSRTPAYDIADIRQMLSRD